MVFGIFLCQREIHLVLIVNIGSHHRYASFWDLRRNVIFQIFWIIGQVVFTLMISKEFLNVLRRIFQIVLGNISMTLSID